ncbi:MAG: hypothetical protein C4293_14020, partial [Nitrospiraceae bacterium]
MRRRPHHLRLLLVSLGLLFGLGLAPPFGTAQVRPTISSLSPPTCTLTQGTTSFFVVTLNAAQPTETVVTLSSSAPDIVYVPSSLTVPAGQTKAAFAVTANRPGTAQIRANVYESGATSTVAVTPAQPTVISLLPPTNPVLLGATTTLTVTLSAAQPMDTVIAITGVPGDVITGPPTVTVPAGEISAPIPMTAVALGTAVVRASLNGSTAEAVVRVTAPAPGLTALQPSPLRLATAASSRLTVTLNAVQPLPVA